MELSRLETEANESLSKGPNYLKSSKGIYLETLMIPLNFIDLKSINEQGQKIKNSLIVSGERSIEYFLWPLNPEDQKYRHELEWELKTHQIPYKKGPWIPVHRTASRSFLIHGRTDLPFSYKGSTDKVPGPFQRSKQLFTSEALATGQISAYFLKKQKELQHKKIPLHHLNFLPDTLVVNTNFSEQSLLFRPLAPLFQWQQTRPSTQKLKYIPAFTFLHNQEGLKLAQKAHLDIFQLLEVVVQSIAQSNVELLLYFGSIVTSNHLQQYLIEMDEVKNLPTGQVFLRDLSDLEIHHDFLEQDSNYGPEMLNEREFSLNNLNYRPYHTPSFNPLLQDFEPQWVSSNTLARFLASVYFKAYNEYFEKLTQINLVTKFYKEESLRETNGYWTQKPKAVPTQDLFRWKIYHNTHCQSLLSI